MDRITVPEIVSAEDLRSYTDNGYLVVENLISDDEIREICGDLPRLIRNDYDATGNFPEKTGNESDDELLQKVLSIHHAHFVSPVIEKYVRHEKIAGVLSQITAAHLPYRDGSVKCMQSMFFAKPAGSPGSPWHQDELYIPTRDRSLVGAWIAIDDATLENGCLWVSPGSHRQGRLYDQRDHNNPGEFDSGQESFGFDDVGAVPVKVARGSVVFFNGYLLHRSRKNNGANYRRVLVSHYMNAWSLLPWPDLAGHMDNRKIMLVAGIDPYAYKGTGENCRTIGFKLIK